MCYDPQGAPEGSTAGPDVSPGTLRYAQAGLGVAGELTSYLGEKASARQARQAAISEFIGTSQGLTDRARQIEIADSQRVLNNAITRLAAGGAIAVGAAEGGLSALSQNRLETAVEQSIGANEAAADLQDEFARTEIDIELTGAKQRLDNTLAANRDPSGLSLILSTAGLALGSSFGPIGAQVGQQLGSVAGRAIDYTGGR